MLEKQRVEMSAVDQSVTPSGVEHIRDCSTKDPLLGWTNQ